MGIQCLGLQLGLMLLCRGASVIVGTLQMKQRLGVLCTGPGGLPQANFCCAAGACASPGGAVHCAECLGQAA